MNCNAIGSWNKKNLSLLLGIALLSVAIREVAFAQVEGSFSGRVEDASGAAIPAATVSVTNLETGAARSVATDEGGLYRILSLPVGRYSFKAEKVGFSATVQTGINLVVGQHAVINLKLEVGAVQQEVTVTAEAPVVNTTTASVSGLVGERQVKDLPLNGRSFENLITLNAGAVNFTSNTATIRNGSPSVGSSFSIAGRRASENLYLLNGVEYMSAGARTVMPGGVSGLLLGIDAVREFNLAADSYSAEYGKRPGGQVSIVTQSGTNQLHGSAFEFLRNSVLDARNFFDHGTIPPFKRNQFGGAAGGPIRKDKTFIFGNYEGFRQRLGVSAVTIVPDANARLGSLPDPQTKVPTPVTGLNPAMLPYMALWPLPNGPNLGGGVALSYSNPAQAIREDFGTVRMDQTFSARDSVSGVYTIDDGYNLSPLANYLFSTAVTDRAQVVSAQEEHIFSPEMINTFRVGYTRAAAVQKNYASVSVPDSLSLIAGMGPTGAITIGGGAGGTGAGAAITPAGTTGGPSVITRNLFSYSDDLQWIKGKHQISVGAWFQRLQDNRITSARKAGAASFTSFQTFLQGTVSSFNGVPFPPLTGYRMTMGAWYVEDNITLRPNLSIRVGLRHEFTNGWNEVLGRMGNYIPDSNGVLETAPLIGGNEFTENNAKWLFGPRVGLAWDPFGKGKTSIRAGLGTHYSLQDGILGFYIEGNPPYKGTVVFGQNASFPPLVPVRPGLSAPVSCGSGVPQPCTIYAPQGIQPNMQTPTVEEWNFTIEQQITPNTSFRAAYVGSHGYHELTELDMNSIHAQICSNAGGCPSGGINSVKGFVPQGTQYIPVGTRPNPYLANGLFAYSNGNSSYNALQLDVTHRFSHGLQFRANYTWAKNMDIMSEMSSSGALNEPAQLLNRDDPKRDWGPAASNITNQANISGTYELPFGQGKSLLTGTRGVANRLASGWQVNWIVTLLGGFPFTPLVGSNQSGNGDLRNPDRPSVNPSFSGPIILGKPNQWFNPNAYSLPMSGTWGNLGRGVLTGPGLGELDLSLFKTTKLTERINLQFRAEFFNILNRANFGAPNAVTFLGSAVSPSAGVVSSTQTTSRQIQFGLKLIF